MRNKMQTVCDAGLCQSTEHVQEITEPIVPRNPALSVFIFGGPLRTRPFSPVDCSVLELKGPGFLRKAGGDFRT